MPTQIAVAYEDDSHPVMQLWDLRSPTTFVHEYQAHTKVSNCASRTMPTACSANHVLQTCCCGEVARWAGHVSAEHPYRRYVLWSLVLQGGWGEHL